jgi:hypothetical protein
MRTKTLCVPLVSRERQQRSRFHRDDGTLLVDLMVGIVLMSIFMGMFTGAVVMMNKAMTKSIAVNLSSSQLNVAFQNLDKTVRYAAAISAPGISTGTGATGDWYVELRATSTGNEVCTQLRVDIVSQQLQQRKWNVVNAVASTPSVWSPIASGISNGGAISGALTQPFYLLPPLSNSLFQQLTVNLISPSGSGSSLTTSSSSFTFTALNSLIPAPIALSICSRAVALDWRP